MTIIEAVVLGIVQGLTEFLPVSSSGHLELVKAVLGAETIPHESLLFTVVVHAATALSTIVIFRNEVRHIVLGLVQFSKNDELCFTVKILISMVPAAAVGIFFDEQIEMLFGGRIALVGCMLMVTGIILFLADRARSTQRDVSYRDALIVGIAQAIAILPGISRSGATISTSVMLGINREKAARFSFLMVVPLILGKITLDLLKGDLSADNTNFMPLLAGFTAAFVSGLLACKWMIQIVKNCKLSYFSFYCLIAGAVTVIASKG